MGKEPDTETISVVYRTTFSRILKYIQYTTECTPS